MSPARFRVSKYQHDPKYPVTHREKSEVGVVKFVVNLFAVIVSVNQNRDPGVCLNTAVPVSGKALAAGFCRRITCG